MYACDMHHRFADCLLNAIAVERDLTTSYGRIRGGHLDEQWSVCAISSDGQLWRSTHHDLLMAVVLLFRLIRREAKPLEHELDEDRAERG